MSVLKVNTINDASGGSNAVLYGVAAPANSMGFRNRIINGDMRIDQRNAGASVTPSTAAYLVDRWTYNFTQASKFSFQQNAGSVTPPTGFTNYLGATVVSAVSIGAGDVFVLRQRIEGFNVSDLGWGTASAQAVTLSFWVRSSLTGTFGGSFQNNAENRGYPFTYTISSANTWEQKTVTVAGDTTGTWLTNNGTGILLGFSLGTGSTNSGTAGAWAGANYSSATGAVSVVGTSGATLYITGVQLEAGSVASPFERRDYGRELIMCQRYYETSFADGVAPGTLSTAVVNTGAFGLYGSYAGSFAFPFKIRKRVAPTVTVYAPLDGTSSGRVRRGDTGAINTVSSPLITQEYANLNIDSGVSAALYQFGFAATAEL